MNDEQDGTVDPGWTGVYTANPAGGSAPANHNFTVVNYLSEGSNVDAAFTVNAAS